MYLLGFAQLGKFEIHENEKSLKLAQLSFEASIDLESKTFEDSEVHEKLKEQEWFFKMTSEKSSSSTSKFQPDETNQNENRSQNKLSSSISSSSNSANSKPKPLIKTPTQPETSKLKPSTSATVPKQGSNGFRKSSVPNAVQTSVPQRRTSQPVPTKTNTFRAAVQKHTGAGINIRRDQGPYHLHGRAF